MDNLNNKISNEEQSQPSCLGAVSGSTYGFIIEFKSRKYEYAKWENHWNHKIYMTHKDAEEAIEQMKKAYSFYRDDYDWNIGELYCR